MSNKQNISYSDTDVATILVCRVVIAICSVISTFTTAAGFYGFFCHSFPLSLFLSFIVQASLLITAFRFSERNRVKNPVLVTAGCMILLCFSSSFSYVFFSNSAYSFNWESTVQQIVLQEYRQTLFDTQDQVDLRLQDDINQLNLAVQNVSEPILNDSSLQNATAEDLTDQVKEMLVPLNDYMNADRFYLFLNQTAADAKSALDRQDQDEIDALAKKVADKKAELAERLHQITDRYNDEVKNYTSVSNNLRRTSDPALRQSLNSQLQSISKKQEQLDSSKQGYQIMEDALAVIENSLGAYQASSVGNVRAALTAFQEQMLTIHPDVSIMKASAETLVDYARQKQQDNSSTSYSNLSQYVSALNRRIDSYEALLELDTFLAAEAKQLSTVQQDLEAAQTADRLAAEADETLTYSSLQSTMHFWLRRVENLRDHIAMLPVYTGSESLTGSSAETENTALIDPNLRTTASKKLDWIINVFLTENINLINARNYLTALPWGYRMQAFLTLFGAFMIDMVPFLLNYRIYTITENAAAAAAEEDI